MSSLITQAATLAALLVLLAQLLGDAPLERTLVIAGASGLAVYGALVVGAAITQRVLAELPDAPPPEETPEGEQAPPGGDETP